MFFEIEMDFKRLIKEYQLFLIFMGKSSTNGVEVLWVFQNCPDKHLYVFETPNLPTFVFTFIVFRVFYHLIKGLMSYG